MTSKKRSYRFKFQDLALAGLGFIFLILVVTVFYTGQDKIVKNAGATPYSISPSIYSVLGENQYGGMSYFTKADVNNDSAEDLIAASAYWEADVWYSRLSVLLGNSNGTFNSAVHYDIKAGVEEGPLKIVVQDFNNDGAPDIASANKVGNTISILLNVGNGTFGIVSEYPVGNAPTEIESVDFNNDNYFDLVVGNYGDGNISVLLNNQDGTFGLASIYGGAHAFWTKEIKLADLNNDGFLDIVSTEASSIVPFLNNGDGTFTEQTWFNFHDGWADMCKDFIFQDLNDDSNLDIIVACGRDKNIETMEMIYGGIFVASGQGDGSFGPATEYQTGLSPFAISLADVDNDGIKDLIVGSFDLIYSDYANNKISVYKGSSNGEFTLWQDIAVKETPYIIYLGDYLTKYNSYFKIIDVNNDGYLDLVINRMTVFLNQQNGTFSCNGRYGTASPFPYSIADFNGDGNQDILAGNGGIFVLSYGSNNGVFKTLQNYPVLGDPANLLASDFNNDSNLDIVSFNASFNTIGILLGNSNGAFREINYFNTGIGPISGVVADFNNDSKEDLAVVNSTANNVSILVGDGNGSFSDLGSVSTGNSPIGIISQDFNNDGKADFVIVNNADNNIGIYMGNGDGTFSAPVTMSANNQPRNIISKDLNNDEKIDLAVTNSGSNNISIFLGNNDGTFQAKSDLDAGITPYDLVADDFNKDGVQDLAVVDYGDTSGSAVAILLGKEDGGYISADFYYILPSTAGSGTIYPHSYEIVSTDLNNDTYPDVAVTNSGFGTISPFLNNGDGTFHEYTTIPIGTYGLIAADFNHDNRNDFASNTDHAINVALDLDFVLNALEKTAIYAGSPISRLQIKGSGFTDNTVARFDASNRATQYIDTSNLQITLTSSDLVQIGSHEISLYQPELDLTTDPLPLNIQSVFTDKIDTDLSIAPTNGIIFDFNSDGKSDLALLDNSTNKVLIMQGIIYGRFNQANSYDTEANPSAIASGDLNGDNKNDLFIVNSGTNSISILLGDGSGNFTPDINSPIAAGQFPSAISSADLNGDNNIDLVWSNKNDNNIQIFINQEGGVLAEAAGSPLNVGNQPNLVKIADINKDSQNDILVLNEGSNNFTVFLGDGSGNFTLGSGSPIATGTQPKDLCLSDINKDAKYDLAFVNKADNNVSIYFGNGSGGFTWQNNLSLGVSADSIVCQDFTVDGNIDLAVNNSAGNSLTLLLGDGNGFFGPAVNYATNVAPIKLFTASVNSDIIPDILALNSGSNDFSVLLGRTLLSGNSILKYSHSYTLTDVATDFIISDFNNDNKQDLAIGSNTTGKVYIYNGAGQGQFTESSSYLLRSPLTGLNMDSCDLNNDSFNDLVIGNQINFKQTLPNVYVLFNNGDGTFGNPIPFMPVKSRGSVSCGDFNGDNMADFAVVGNYPNPYIKVFLYINNGNSTFTVTNVYPETYDGPNGYDARVKAGDLDFDGFDDLVITVDKGYDETDNQGYVLMNNGNLTFNMQLQRLGWGKAYMADLDNDDYPDFINYYGIQLNKRDNTLEDPNLLSDILTNYIPIFTQFPPAYGDFNNDGWLDLATIDIKNQSLGASGTKRLQAGIRIVLGIGNGRFDQQSTYSIGGVKAVKVSSADINEDNLDDVLLLNDNRLDIFLGYVPRGGGSRVFMSAPADFKCTALSANTLRWDFSDSNSSEDGFRLYNMDTVLVEIEKPDLSYIEEINLQPNTKYSDRYVVAYNGFGNSNASLQLSCVTLANRPLAPFITRKDQGVNVAINPTDGNPYYTEYTLYEYLSAKYVQPDGTLSENVAWGTFASWGGKNGINVSDVGDNYRFYVMARNSDGQISGFDLKSMNLDCQAKSSTEINWYLKAPASLDVSGFSLYKEEQGKNILVADISSPDSRNYDYLEVKLQPNTRFQRFFNTYKTVEDKKIESEFSNVSTCYTLANEPLPVIIGDVTSDSIQIIIDNNDGNPSGTLYALYEAKSGKYVQADGSLGSDPVWQTYTQWGGSAGIFVKFEGTLVQGQVKLSANIDLKMVEFSAQVKNGDGIVAGNHSSTSILATKGVAINQIVRDNTFLAKIAAASNGSGSESVALRLIREFSMLLNLILLILILLLAYNLYSSFVYINPRQKLKYLFSVLSKEPAVLFNRLASKDKYGSYQLSYHKHKSDQVCSQNMLRAVFGILAVKVLVLMVIIFGLVGLRYAGNAEELNYNGDTIEVKAGDKLSYIIRITNTGNSAATGIVVTDIFDSNLSYTENSAKVNNIEVNPSFEQNYLIFNPVRDLDINQTAVITFDAIVKDTVVDRVVNKAQISGSNFDLAYTNEINNPVKLQELIIDEKKIEEIAAPVGETIGQIHTPSIGSSSGGSIGSSGESSSESEDVIGQEVNLSIWGSFLNVMTEDVSKTQVVENILSTISQNETVKTIVESKPVKFVEEKVLNNPVVEQASQDVVTPTLVTVAVINTAPAFATASLNFWSFLHFLFVEPLLILFRKKRKNWGVVYDSLTKMPISLALVRLYRKEDRRLVQTRVTDREGRYLIMVKDPGLYYLEVTKPNYDYPSKILSTEKNDTKYIDLYHGEELNIQDKEASISANIPLDVRDVKVKPISAVIRSFALQNLKNVISYVGLILAILVLIIYPSVITILALVFHIIFYVIFKKLLVPAKPKGWGIVYDEKNKEALNNVVVRLFDIKYNKLLETQLTDNKGRYAFLVGKNVYQMMLEKEGYQTKEVKPVDLTSAEQIVNLDVALAKQDKASTPEPAKTDEPEIPPATEAPQPTPLSPVPPSNEQTQQPKDPQIQP